MIVNERITAYINSLDTENGELLEAVAREAKASHVPIIRRETASLLKTMVAVKSPQSILEVGTAVGYSALIMSRVMPPGCHITTIEKFKKRIPIALKNFKRAGREKDITLMEGDADEILGAFCASGETYDFIFMDAAKGQYIHWLPMILKLLSVGGVLFSDNVLQGGDIIESRYAVERRDRTIHSRMREYLYQLKHTDGLETAVVPIGDGVTISTRLY